jgi:hypothetical protein
MLLCVCSVGFAAELGRGDRPANAQRREADTCLRYSDPKLSLMRFIINFCKKTVYVSVIEFSADEGKKYCAVYGLLGNRYGKQYGPNEYYERNSLQATYSVDRALDFCKYSGYETTGQGLGDFMRIVKD